MYPSTALASVVLDELTRCGVREVVLCPGSRSAPLAYAAADLERQGQLRLHVRVDERSAGFLALGLAKETRRPAVVITTSGTAVANLHPAVLEASHGAVPLIVLSADRPADLRGTGANQTTRQPGIFGGAVRFSRDQPPATGYAGEQAGWRSTVCRAVAAAVGHGGDAGPAHLNVALREPLTPDRNDSTWGEDLAGRPDGMPWVQWEAESAVLAAPAEMTVSTSAAPEPRHTRTLMVLGDLPDPALAARALKVAAEHDWPVIAEPFGTRPAIRHASLLGHGPLVLADTTFVQANTPGRVLMVGRTTLHRDLAASGLTGRSDVTVQHVSATTTWTDPSHMVSAVHSWRWLTGSQHASNDPAWTQHWRSAGDALSDRLSPALTGSSVAGVSIAHAVLAGLSSADTLVLGSSNTPRDLNVADPEAAGRATIIGNRGLSGIDGTVSSAVGTALAHQGPGRVVALLGDLTFQHDINGLLIGSGEPRPDLTIVINNDDGGGIFATLEYGKGEHRADLRRLFTTPIGVDCEALCRGYGVAHQRVDTLDGLTTALAAPVSGIRVIEVVVDPIVDQQARDDLRTAAAQRTGLTGY